MELDAARENARHMLDLLQQRENPDTSQTFHTEAENYLLHIGAAEIGIEDAETCGEKPIDLSWIGEFRRLHGTLVKPPRNEADAHSQFEALDSVADWLRRDVAGLPRPGSPSRRAYWEAELSEPGVVIGPSRMDAGPPSGPWTPPPGAPYTKDDADRVQKLFEQTLGVMSEAVDENVEEQAAASITEDIEPVSREIGVAPDTIRAVLRDMGAIQ